ncbi:hypothetical protein [Bradyrhizobium sp.]|uniref:hypothetical protein n=1 Tax=Bradyrhizobium sp. TaxID=376 RepID=UPI003C1CA8AA
MAKSTDFVLASSGSGRQNFAKRGMNEGRRTMRERRSVNSGGRVLAWSQGQKARILCIMEAAEGPPKRWNKALLRQCKFSFIAPAGGTSAAPSAIGVAIACNGRRMHRERFN